MKEISIIGGGLAGLCLGIGLRRRGIPVVLHEASTYPRHRVCGEFIAGAGSAVFEQLGVADCLNDARRLRDTVWRYHGEIVLQKGLPKAALGISRYRLDERLADKFVSLGGQLETKSRFQQNGRQEGMVWANGRERGESQWIGLKMHCQAMKTLADLEVHLGDHAYVGVCPVENDCVNVCGLFQLRKVEAHAREDQLPAYLVACGLGDLAERVRNGAPDALSAIGVTALSYEQRSPDGEIRLGDQSGLIAPFTGNGMALAMESAALAVEPLSAYATNQAGWKATVDMVNQRVTRTFYRRRRIARRLHPWLLAPRKQKLLATLAQSGLLPFGVLFRLTH
ncbi:NAD(P)/FAD-dependent oxidoreductase [Cerasicoccus frondis]|uniref:NAD(P)/FAD-dependent oxidoreductase n=1 Tax=Cerasicoccus frondis TaxID=490090 RepID=UPI0028526468|nr:FAD-dependent monooxygenase [Cerasicoccus frondis]